MNVMDLIASLRKLHPETEILIEDGHKELNSDIGLMLIPEYVTDYERIPERDCNGERIDKTKLRFYKLW